jgi:hypothetical protein
MATDWDAVEAAIHAWVVAGSSLSESQVVWTQQPDAPRPPEPAIMLKFYVIDESHQPMVDTEDNPLVFSDLTVSAVSGNNLTSTTHDLLNGDGPVTISSTLTLPSPLEEDTNYWVIKVDDDTISLAATYTNSGGWYSGNPQTPITLTSTGSGVITISDTSATLRAGEEILHVARGVTRLGLSLYCHTSTGVSMGSAMAILRRVGERARLPSQKAILSAANIGLVSVERTRPLYGTKDALLFEPRAWVDIHMTLPFEVSETGSIIGRTDIENLTTGITTRVENEDL